MMDNIGMAMRKTLIYLTEEQLQALRGRAKANRTSLAAVVRDAVSAYLGQPERSPIEDFIGCAEGEAGGDTSSRADEILRKLLG